MKQLHMILSAISFGLIAAMIILYLPYLLAGALVAIAVLMLLGLIGWFWLRHKVKGLSRQFEEQFQRDLGNMGNMSNTGGFQRAKGLDGTSPYDSPFGQSQNDASHWPGEEIPRREPRAGTGPIIHIKPEEIS